MVIPFVCAGHSGTITSTDATGTAEINEFQLTEDIYAKGSGMSPDADYEIYIIVDTTITLGMSIPSSVVQTINVTTDSSGAFGPTLIWDAAPPELLLLPGDYDIIADCLDYGTQGVYDVYDAIDDNEIHTTAGFFVIPQIPLGTISVLLACFAAMLFKRKKVF
jgi:hypothetical protein